MTQNADSTLGRTVPNDVPITAGLRPENAEAGSLARQKCLLGSSLILLATFCSVAFAQTSPTSPWSHLSLTGGPTLDSSSYVYDPGSNRMIVYGGADSQAGCFTTVGDTWLITNANGMGGTPLWQPVSPAGTPPPARNRASAVYDQKNNRMIMFGGASCGGVAPELYNDVWILSNANGVGGTPTWIPLNPPAPLPAGRAEHSAVYDPSANTMTIFGGCNDGIMDVPNDVWVLNSANGRGGQPSWIQLAPTGTLPAPRCSAVVTYSATTQPASSVMTVYGGCCPSLGDLWVLTGANGVAGSPAWQQLAQNTPAPGPLETRAFGYDADLNLLMFFGGYSYPGPVYDNGVWMLQDANDVGGTPAWVSTIANGSPGSPPPGSGYAGVYDGTSKRLIVTEDPDDLWVMTTRNGIDVSCTAGVPTSAQLSELQQAGIQYVVAEAPQGQGSLCPNVSMVETARKQLDKFATKFKTAAYCFLHFGAADAGTGSQQAQNCLNTIQPSRFSTISFVALDVEESPELGPADARLIISQALTTITANLPRSVIYTKSSGWNPITGHWKPAFASDLWITGGSFQDSQGSLHCGDGVPSLTPSTATFGGWTTLSGKQYDFGVVQDGVCVSPTLADMTVDYDVFDPALFTNP
jgi:hypothetical protein